MKTRHVAALAATIISLSSTVATAVTAVTSPARRVGDVNRDGKVTAADATMVLQHYTLLSSGNAVVNHPDIYLGDVDRDGKITVSDATAILQYYCTESAGNVPQWPDFNFVNSAQYVSLCDLTVYATDGTTYEISAGERFYVRTATPKLLSVYVPKANGGHSLLLEITPEIKEQICLTYKS